MPGVMLEALAAGLPVVCLDHLGMGDTINADCGVKFPVTTPRDVCRRFGEAVRQVVADPAEWERLSRGAVARAERFRWSYQGRRLAELYRDVLVRHGRTEFEPRGESAELGLSSA
jgi:glycosyltransferase involved in cell wall biosynthesis